MLVPLSPRFPGSESSAWLPLLPPSSPPSPPVPGPVPVDLAAAPGAQSVLRVSYIPRWWASAPQRGRRQGSVSASGCRGDLSPGRMGAV